MKTHKDLLKIIALLKAEDSESYELGMKLFKQSSFIKQFQGNLSCLGFLFYNFQRKLTYMSYKELCNHLKFHPEVLAEFAYNRYKAFLIIKNNRLLWQ